MRKKRKKGKHLIILPVTITVIGILFAFFALLNVFTYGNIMSIFSQDIAPGDEQISGISTPAPDSLNRDAFLTPAPSATPTPAPTPVPEPVPPDITAYKPLLTGSEYITAELQETDIHSGYLVLVNTEIYYDIPEDLGLVSISDERNSAYRVNAASQRLRASIMPQLNDMMQGFMDETGNSYMYIISAYRDYAAQRNVYNRYINEPGRAARAGHSEHHTGLAIDMATLINGVQRPFDNFEIVKRWFTGNSYKYGFIHRYPGSKTSITKVISEPWHYRYVGMPHSYIMFRFDWVLEEYVENIREYTMDEPLMIDYGGESYEIFFTQDTVLTLPVRAKYDISGNNTDGFIVTIYGRYDRLTNVTFE